MNKRLILTALAALVMGCNSQGSGFNSDSSSESGSGCNKCEKKKCSSGSCQSAAEKPALPTQPVAAETQKPAETAAFIKETASVTSPAVKAEVK